MFRISASLSVFFLLFLTATSVAQETKTINFQNVSFDEARQLSQKSGKLIFLDCYTSWCMPCRWMEQNVFVNDSVYNFYNRHFINFKIDMEKGEGVELRKKYEVKVFPTYLFVDAKGNVIHRTTSRMEVAQFLEEGKRALNPARSFSALEMKYKNGDRPDSLLFAYTLALERINRQKSDEVKKELIAQIADTTLGSSFGWKVIKSLANDENGRLGKYLMDHQKHFEHLAGEQEVTSVTNRMASYKMYQLIRDNNKEEFFQRLDKMRKDPDAIVQRNVAMFEMEYYLNTNNADSFVVVANKAKKGILEYKDADLSFIARRASYQGNGNKEIENEALLLAKQAVVLNPEEYSNQGTLASICLQLGRKEEGIKAAKKARKLADVFTSKIQKLAQELLDKLEAL